MKASELRIGNYIIGKYETELDRGAGIIEDIEAQDTVIVAGYDPIENYLFTENGNEYDDFEPIPLTEEWLLKFGFEENEYMGYKLYQKIYEDNLRIFTVGVKTKRGYEFDGWKQLKYVHQLQNLYHALCGHELKTKQDDK